MCMESIEHNGFGPCFRGDSVSLLLSDCLLANTAMLRHLVFAIGVRDGISCLRLVFLVERLMLKLATFMHVSSYP